MISEIQTAGLRVTSYGIDGDGLPIMSRQSLAILGFGLKSKLAFEAGVIYIHDIFPEYAPAISEAPVVEMPRVAVKIFPQPSAELEDHTESPSAEVGVTVRDAESLFLRSGPMLDSAPPIAGTRKVIDEDIEVIPEAFAAQSVKAAIDTDNILSSLQAIDIAPLAGAKNDEMSRMDIEATETRNGASGRLSRRQPVRLSDDERADGLELGLLKPFAPKLARQPSVLDKFPPIRGQKKTTPPRQVSKALLVKKVVEQNGKCVYCDRAFGSDVWTGKPERLTAEVEHFSPSAVKLLNSTGNIVAGCQVCNRLKSSRVFETIEEARGGLQHVHELGFPRYPPACRARLMQVAFDTPTWRAMEAKD